MERHRPEKGEKVEGTEERGGRARESKRESMKSTGVVRFITLVQRV